MVLCKENSICLDVAQSIDAFKAKIKLWMHRMGTGKLAAFLALNLFVKRKILICMAFVQSFLSTTLHLFPSWIGMFLPKIIVKYLIGYEVLLKQGFGSGSWNRKRSFFCGSAKNLLLPLPHRLLDLKSNLVKKFCPFPDVD